MQANERFLSRAAQAIRATLQSANELSRFQVAVIVALVLLVAGGSITAYLRSRPRAVEVAQPSGNEKRPALNVHVAGAVARPGLYRMAEGSRAADALEEAGGATSDAMVDDINLAARLKDGEKLMVPAKVGIAADTGTEQQSPTGCFSPAAGPCPVNINTAGRAELETLPGIGPVYAGRILDYRSKNGPFSSVDELESVPGIGPRKLESLEGLVKI